MPELEKDRTLIQQSMEAATSAFEHHTKIMQELELSGFKPNPIPQVGIEQPSPQTKTCVYFS